jgi:hypothetical protein
MDAGQKVALGCLHQHRTAAVTVSKTTLAIDLGDGDVKVVRRTTTQPIRSIKGHRYLNFPDPSVAHHLADPRRPSVVGSQKWAVLRVLRDLAGLWCVTVRGRGAAGRADGSVQALYAHVTDGMLRDLLDGLTRVWEQALAERRQPSPRSPVAVLDRC